MVQFILSSPTLTRLWDQGHLSMEYVSRHPAKGGYLLLCTTLNWTSEQDQKEINVYAKGKKAFLK